MNSIVFRVVVDESNVHRIERDVIGEPFESIVASRSFTLRSFGPGWRASIEIELPAAAKGSATARAIETLTDALVNGSPLDVMIAPMPKVIDA